MVIPQLEQPADRGGWRHWLLVTAQPTLFGETVPGTGEVARFPAETLGTHKDGNTEHPLWWLPKEGDFGINHHKQLQLRK
jgi:hypothetical protein